MKPGQFEFKAFDDGEVIAIHIAGNHALWMRRELHRLGFTHRMWQFKGLKDVLATMGDAGTSRPRLVSPSTIFTRKAVAKLFERIHKQPFDLSSLAGNHALPGWAPLAVPQAADPGGLF